MDPSGMMQTSYEQKNLPFVVRALYKQNMNNIFGSAICYQGIMLKEACLKQHTFLVSINSMHQLIGQGRSPFLTLLMDY